jgi:hypothetical protein
MRRGAGPAPGPKQRQSQIKKAVHESQFSYANCGNKVLVKDSPDYTIITVIQDVLIILLTSSAILGKIWPVFPWIR